MDVSTVKRALRITSYEFDADITAWIAAAKSDMGLTDIFNTDETDNLISRAIITFCRMQFELLYGNGERYQLLKAAYDEQKAQLITATGYGIEEDESESGTE